MVGGPDKKGGSSEKFSEQLKGAQRLVSRLQRAVRSGRTSRREMREVDRYLSAHLTSRTANILDIIDTLLHKSRSERSKEMLGHLYIDVMGVFSEFRSLESHGYSTLIQPDRTIDPVKLDELIDLDNEMSTYVAKLESDILEWENRNRFSKGMCDQVRHLNDIILELLEKRRQLVETS